MTVLRQFSEKRKWPNGELKHLVLDELMIGFGVSARPQPQDRNITIRE